MRKKLVWNKMIARSKIFVPMMLIAALFSALYFFTEYQRWADYENIFRILGNPAVPAGNIDFAAGALPSVDTSGWNVFRDQEKALSYKYPSGWSVKKYLPEDGNGSPYFIATSASGRTTVYVVPLPLPDTADIRSAMYFRQHSAFHGTIISFKAGTLSGFIETYARDQYKLEDATDPWSAEQYFVMNEHHNGVGANLILSLKGALSPEDETYARHVAAGIVGSLEL